MVTIEHLTAEEKRLGRLIPEAEARLNQMIGARRQLQVLISEWFTPGPQELPNSGSPDSEPQEPEQPPSTESPENTNG